MLVIVTIGGVLAGAGLIVMYVLGQKVGYELGYDAGYAFRHELAMRDRPLVQP